MVYLNIQWTFKTEVQVKLFKGDLPAHSELVIRNMFNVNAHHSNRRYTTGSEE